MERESIGYAIVAILLMVAGVKILSTITPEYWKWFLAITLFIAANNLNGIRRR